MRLRRLALWLGFIGLSCGGRTDEVRPSHEDGSRSGVAGVAGRAPDSVPVSSCFARDTLIATPNGSIPIQDVRVGDLVQGFDVLRQVVVTRPVTEVFVHERQRIGLLRASHGDVRVTANHPIYDAASLAFVPAGSSTSPFQALELASTWSIAPSTVGGFTPLDELETVYNFTVADVHTYFAAGVLVHNKSRCGYPGDPPDCPCWADECRPQALGGASGASGAAGLGGGFGGVGAGGGGGLGGSGGANGGHAAGENSVAGDNAGGGESAAGAGGSH